jgi:hypothetical protein
MDTWPGLQARLQVRLAAIGKKGPQRVQLRLISMRPLNPEV